MTLEEMLADAQIADDLEISFGDKGKFKLGDLRAADRSRKAKAADEDKRYKDQLAVVAAKQKELNDLATQAADLITRLKTEPEKTPTKTEEIDFDSDPLFGPLVSKRLKPLEAKFEKTVTDLNKAIEALSNNFNSSATFVMRDYYDRRWNAIPEDRRPKDKTWKDYLKIASERHIVDEFGVPDPIKAFDDEWRPQAEAALRKQVDDLTKKNQELEKAATAPRMPRPGAAGAPKATRDKEKVYGSADELVDDAMNDPLIQGLMGGNA